MVNIFFFRLFLSSYRNANTQCRILRISNYSYSVSYLSQIHDSNYFLSQSYHLKEGMLFVNGGNFVQTFFFISGFLNSISLLAKVEKNQVNYFYAWFGAVFYRFIRFAPVLIFMVMLNATWLYRLDSGPFWDKIVYTERQSCRENWWTNILFINNYISGDLKCMIQTWYICADFHLSAVGTFILLLIVQ